MKFINWVTKSEKKLFWFVFLFCFLLRAIPEFIKIFLPTKIYALDDDPSVYYTSAKLLLNHSFPYKDFLMLHPPGTIFYMLPFAILGKFISDYVALQIGNYFGMLIVAFAYAYLVKFLYRFSKIRAFWTGLILSSVIFFVIIERSYVQELLINVLLIISIITFVKIIETKKLKYIALLGFLLASQMSIKILGVINIFIILLMFLLLKKYSNIFKTILFILISLVIIDLPLILISPQNAFNMIIVAQIKREKRTGIFDQIFFFANPNIRQILFLFFMFCVILFILIVYCYPNLTRTNDYLFFLSASGTLLNFCFLLSVNFSIFHYTDMLAVYTGILLPYCIVKFQKKKIVTNSILVIAIICSLFGLFIEGNNTSSRYVNINELKKDTKSSGCIWSNFMSLQITIDNLDNIIKNKCPFAVDFFGIQIADYAHIKYPENNNKMGQIGNAEKIVASQMSKSKVLLITTEIDSLIPETFSVDKSLHFVLTPKNKFKTIEIWHRINY